MESNGVDGNSAENGITNKSASTTVNQDEQIMLQKQAIEEEIKRKSKLIGDLEDLSTVQDEFKQDPVYLAKVINLASKYSRIRRTRPDGNCFFRALAFAYFEKMCLDVESFKQFHAAVSPSKDMMIAEGFSSFAVEDFYDSFMEQLEKLGPGSERSNSATPQNSDASSSNGESSKSDKKEANIDVDSKLGNLIDTFNDQGMSDYIVVFLRLLTSMHLKKEAEFYQNFMEGDMTVANFCSLEVEPMYHESDHIHVIAITKQAKINVRIQYLDRGSATEATSHDFPEETAVNPDVHLLYRPGHYDILYPKIS